MKFPFRGRCHHTPYMLRMDTARNLVNINLSTKGRRSSSANPIGTVDLPLRHVELLACCPFNNRTKEPSKPVFAFLRMLHTIVAVIRSLPSSCSGHGRPRSAAGDEKQVWRIGLRQMSSTSEKHGDQRPVTWNKIPHTCCHSLELYFSKFKLAGIDH